MPQTTYLLFKEKDIHYSNAQPPWASLYIDIGEKEKYFYSSTLATPLCNTICGLFWREERFLFMMACYLLMLCH